MYRIADAHCDFLAYRTMKKSNGQIQGQSSYFSILAGGVKLQNFAVWVPPEDTEKYSSSLEQIGYLRDFIEEHKDVLIMVKSKEDFDSAAEIKIVLSVEGGECIECDTVLIDEVYDMGARIFSLTWNDENEFAGGCKSDAALKEKGRKAIEKFNEKRIALDISHLNEKSFWGAAEVYKHPVCATHSNVYDICESSRNLKKDQIRHIIKTGGFMGISFFPGYLTGNDARISDVIRHVEYVINLGGEDNIGFGPGFCRIKYTPHELDSSADFQKLPEAMKLLGYKDELIDKICYSNFERYILEFL